VNDLVRVSDSDRDRAVASLREHLVQGRLSLEEFTQRMEAAYAAKTNDDLLALARDLPALPAAPVEPPRRAARFLLALFGATNRAGSFRIRGRVVSVAVFGSVTLDLRGALLEGDVVSIQSVTLFGALDVIVPEGVEVDLTGLAVFGSKETRGKPGVMRPGSPLVRVNALVLFGGATVRVKT
jgi:hypothetical protein